MEKETADKDKQKIERMNTDSIINIPCQNIEKNKENDRNERMITVVDIFRRSTEVSNNGVEKTRDRDMIYVYCCTLIRVLIILKAGLVCGCFFRYPTLFLTILIELYVFCSFTGLRRKMVYSCGFVSAITLLSRFIGIFVFYKNESESAWFTLIFSLLITIEILEVFEFVLILAFICFFKELHDSKIEIIYKKNFSFCCCRKAKSIT